MSDELLEDELLAPQVLRDADEETTDTPSDTWRFSHGFADARQAVRIWVDRESRRLERVRVSPRWRDRLAGRPLADAFGEAFFLANVRFGTEGDLRIPDEEPVDVEYNGTFDQLEERFAALTDRFNELEARAPENVRWADFERQRVTASSAGGRVTVTLSLAGLTELVEIDRSWLATAEAGEIGEHVLAAHRRAYERYVPPTFVAGEREELAAEFRYLQAALHSLMSRGIA